MSGYFEYIIVRTLYKNNIHLYAFAYQDITRQNVLLLINRNAFIIQDKQDLLVATQNYY